MLVVALVFLTAGYFAPVVLSAAALFGTIGFHYLVWGRWLARFVEAESQRAEPPAIPETTASTLEDN